MSWSWTVIPRDTQNIKKKSCITCRAHNMHTKNQKTNTRQRCTSHVLIKLNIWLSNLQKVKESSSHQENDRKLTGCNRHAIPSLLSLYSFPFFSWNLASTIPLAYHENTRDLVPSWCTCKLDLVRLKLTVQKIDREMHMLQHSNNLMRKPMERNMNTRNLVSILFMHTSDKIKLEST